MGELLQQIKIYGYSKKNFKDAYDIGENMAVLSVEGKSKYYACLQAYAKFLNTHVYCVLTKKGSSLLKNLFTCRGDRIRTCDHLVPNQARYRTALHPVSERIILVCILKGRGDRIRTCDHLVPNQARYRTALHPVFNCECKGNHIFLHLQILRQLFRYETV